MRASGSARCSQAASHREKRQLESIIKPWGSEKLLATGKGYAVKEITVNPRGRLSLQSHEHRSEVWMVTQGEGWVTNRDGKPDRISAGGSVFIQQGHKHRIDNRGGQQLVFVEIQHGERCVDDDIVRYEDDYGRC